MRIAGSLALIVAGLALGAAAWATPDTPFVLHVAYRSDFDFIDPALAYYTHSWNAEYATCVKLVNVDDRGGIVPEAAPFPQISKDGRTYTFAIRSGFRFYPGGQPLTAADFAWSIRREVVPRMSSPATTYLQDIVGAKHLLAGRVGHPLGVHTRGAELTITLVQPASDFVARLTMPFFCAVRTGTLVDPDGAGAPLASAGPYYFAEWRRGGFGAVLRRNPYYHGPRPHRASEIDISVRRTFADQQSDVEHGKIDVGTPSDSATLANRYGVNRQRFWVEPEHVVWALWFHPESPVFKDNPDLRRAIGFALDRPALIRAWGPFAGRPTAQIIPPGVPGFAKPEPYPLDGPHLATAQALAEGNLRGGKAKLGVYFGSPLQPVAEELKRELATIGLDVEIDMITTVVCGPRACPPDDMYIGGWGVDDPDPYSAFPEYALDATGQRRLEMAEHAPASVRAQTFAQLDDDLLQRDPPIIPFAASNARIFLSARTRCFHWNPYYGVDLASLCTSATTGK